MSAATAILPEIRKTIRFNCDTKLFDCYISIDGNPEQYIGTAANYSDAETKCRDFAFDYYTDTNTPEKAAQVVMSDTPIGQEAHTPPPPPLPATHPSGQPWSDVETPIALLSNGLTVSGHHEKDGSPATALLRDSNGYLYADAHGNVWGRWAGVELEIAPLALPKLRDLFLSNLPSVLRDIARLWTQAGSMPPETTCRSVHLTLTMGVAAHLKRYQGWYGLGKEQIGQLVEFVAQLVSQELGMVEFRDLPALEEQDTGDYGDAKEGE